MKSGNIGNQNVEQGKFILVLRLYFFYNVFALLKVELWLETFFIFQKESSLCCDNVERLL